MSAGLPGTWNMQPIGSISRVLVSTVDKKEHDGERSVRLANYTDVYYNDEINDSPDYMVATATTEQIAAFSVRAHDVAITKDSETPDDIGISAHAPQSLPGVVWGYHLAIYRPIDRRYARFIKRLFDSTPVKVELEKRTPGVTRVGLSSNTLRYLRVPVPPPEVAAKIADYLDRETAEIDAFIADQDELITLLGERVAGLIDRTLAEAARGTRHHRLGYDTSLITSGSRGWAGFYSETGAPFLRIGNLSRGSYRLKRDDVQHVLVPADVEGARTRTRSGDLLFSITAFLGSVGVVSHLDVGSYVSQHVALVRLTSRVNPYFYAYQALGTRVQNQLKSGSYGGTKVQLALGDIADLQVFHPSQSAQADVVARLDEGTATIEAAITDAREAIALLKERRAALISAAVAGQIDVTEKKRVLI